MADPIAPTSSRPMLKCMANCDLNEEHIVQVYNIVHRQFGFIHLNLYSPTL